MEQFTDNTRPTHRLRTLLGLPARYRLWRPQHWRMMAEDLLKPAAQPEHSHTVHLEAVIGWLMRAQDRRDGMPDAGGVSAGWSFEDGWLPSYPETSGYIVETFIAAAPMLKRPELLDRAGHILDWELSIQLPDGAFPGHFGELGSRPVIFNTAQIMHGMVAGYLELGRQECLESAVQAARWLVDQQDSDGCWRRSEHNGIPHTYNTRSAWALLRTGLLASEPGFVDAAVRNLEWALTQVTPSGWFRQNAFRIGEHPFTHTIAYAMRGFLEVGVLAGREQWVEMAARAARALAQAQRADGWLAGEFADDWRPAGNYCCLTGVAQVALIWQRLQQIDVDDAWQPAIDRALSYLKRNHRLTDAGGPEDGGIAGSAPIWGRYSRFEYPNWAAKFFADALLMELSDQVVPAVITARASQTVEPANG
jgi:hypothetical protein